MVRASFLSFALSLGLSGIQVNASPSASADPYPYLGEAIKVPPVRVEHLFPHLRRRDNDLSRLNLQDEVRLTWAHSTGTEKHVFDMKIQKPDPNHPLLSLEELDDLADNITCSEPTISLKFKSKDTMDQALKAWDWINQADADYFYLIANHDGCGPDAERIPYKVVNVTYDATAFTAKLTTEQSSWEETATNHEMWIGSGSHAQSTPTLPPVENFTMNDTQVVRNEGAAPAINLAKRTILDDIGNKVVGVFQTVGNAAKVVKTIFKLLTGGDVVVDLQSSEADKNRVIFQSPESLGGETVPIRFYVNCVGCETKGTINLNAQWKVVASVFTEYVLAAKPKGVSGKFAAQTKIEADIKEFGPDPLLVPIPGISPLTIGAVTIGPSVFAGVGVEAKIKANGVFTAGVEWSIPDTAYLEIHSLNMGASTASGFSGVSIKPSFDIDELNANGEMTIYGLARFALAATFGSKTIGARADFKAGAKVSLAAGALPAGACPREAGDAKAGGVRLGTSLIFEVLLGLGVANTKADVVYKIHEAEKNIDAICFAAPIIAEEKVGSLPSQVGTTPQEKALVQPEVSTQPMQPGSIKVKGQTVPFSSAAQAKLAFI
ncbi:hypothetical protein ABW20_dc0107554 [Dactylellina cionopaga]|nr:hypothetical protein ABW20_dc0107554 [Dactylellina cionopaga]